MENSQQFESAILLGKKIIEELRLVESCDTLSRWMVHHVSELIVLAESAAKGEKAAAENKCRIAILDLWKHVNTHPGHVDIFRELPAIAKTIKALNPDEREYYYYTQAQTAVDAAEVNDQTKTWLNVSRGVDQTARMLIGFSLKHAALSAADVDAKWIELAKSAFPSDLPASKALRIIIGDELDEDEPSELEYRLTVLEDRKSRLASFLAMSEALADEIDNEIAILKSNS